MRLISNFYVLVKQDFGRSKQEKTRKQLSTHICVVEIKETPTKDKI